MYCTIVSLHIFVVAHSHAQTLKVGHRRSVVGTFAK